MTANTFGSRATLKVGGQEYEICRLDAVKGSRTLPFSLKILLENLLRNEDGVNITPAQITALGEWDPDSEPDTEIGLMERPESGRMRLRDSVEISSSSRTHSAVPFSNSMPA